MDPKACHFLILDLQLSRESFKSSQGVSPRQRAHQPLFAEEQLLPAYPEGEIAGIRDRDAEVDKSVE